jgi:hypothetical protein
VTSKTLHIVFSDTVGAFLGDALRELGHADTVACFADDLSFGPINPPDPGIRRTWIRKHLAPDLRDAEWPSRRIAAFWKKALAPVDRRVVWVSKRAAHEFAGFLEFVWRLGEASCDLVEFDEDAVIYRRPDGRMSGGRAICLGELPAEHFAATRYWENAAPLDDAARARLRADWAKLREEDAPLRILTETGMVSAPITYFDDLLIACTVEQWRKAARVVGEAFCQFLDGPFHQVGYFVLATRLRALTEAGRLESQGDLRRPRFSEVRLLGGKDLPEPVT